MLSQVIIDTYGGKKLLQQLGFAILINDKRFIRFFEASLIDFFSVPDDTAAGNGAKAHLWIVADLINEFPAYRRNSALLIVRQLNVVLQFRKKRIGFDDTSKQAPKAEKRP